MRGVSPAVMKTTGLFLALLVLSSGLVAANAHDNASPTLINQVRLQHGKQVFQQICFSCHQITGQGLPGIYPPLAESDFLRHHRNKAIAIVLHGRRGAITVNGHNYNNVMPDLNLSNQQVADVLTYVSEAWGNHAGIVTEKTVAAERKRLGNNPAQSQPDAPAGMTGACGMMAANPMAGTTGNGHMMGQGSTMGRRGMMRGNQ